MKLAEVRYVGPMRSHIRTAPSGQDYTFRKGQGDAPDVLAPVSVLEDASAFDRMEQFEVEWTTRGQLLRRVAGPVDDATEVIADLSYRQKQRLVQALGIDVSANSSEEELEAALQPVAEEMAQQAELTQR